jgi:endoglycosylceramidase
MPEREAASSLFGRPRRALSALAVVLAAAATLVPAAAATSPMLPTGPGPVSTWSTTTGTDGRVYVADAQGRAMQFHGFNIKTTDPAGGATDALLAAAAERGLDHLRLSVFWDQLEPTQGNFDEGYLDDIVTVLDRAEAHGIHVILDMHQDVFGEAFDSSGIPAWATRTDGGAYVPQDVWFLSYLQPAVQNAWEHLYEDADLRQAQIDAWLHVVQRVKGHPAVFGYDLLNEPFGKIRPGEDLFQAAARVERVQLTAMYQRLTDAISAVDPDHWVFIEPPNLASLGIPTSLGEVHGPKVILYPHMYDSSIETATYQPGAEVTGFDPNFFTSWAAAITTYTDRVHIPMLIGEWGIAHPENPGMDEFIRRSLATLDATTSGWSVFNWCVGTGYCPIDGSYQDRPAIGQIFEPYARAIAGAPTSSTYDFASRVLQVRFSDNSASGATEIFLPVSRAYPDGWRVETSDPDGTWSQSFDEATGVLSVTTDRSGGAHAICVKPAGAPAGCTATAPVPPTPPTPVAPAARPVAATPRFTG